MKIGILSDTHGNVTRTREALKILARHNVGAIVHCGDIGSMQCLMLLAESAPRVYAVAGNTDAHQADLESAARMYGIHFGWDSIAGPLGDGRFFAATHGHDSALLQHLIHDPQNAYVFHGHTHLMRDTRVGPVRVINPGAVQRANPHTIAVLDTDDDSLEFVVVL